MPRLALPILPTPDKGLLAQLKRMVVWALALGWFVVQSKPGRAQELLCQIKVDAQQIQNTNQQLFNDMERDIQQFMNNTNWTEREYKLEERIECNFSLQITGQPSSNEFVATFQVNSVRPVYGSTYQSQVLRYVDQSVRFRYDQFQPLEYTQGRYSNELSSILSFYAYVIIGLDADTFTEFGGTSFFQTAEQIAGQAANGPYSGWQSNDGPRTRYWLITYLLDPRFKNMRKTMYQYHRKGLDLMYENVEKGRKAIEESLYLLEPLHERIPNSYLQQVFFDTKYREIGNIFSQAETSTQNDVLEFLRELDLNHFSDYREAIK
jgi:hypothetical protein